MLFRNNRLWFLGLLLGNFSGLLLLLSGNPVSRRFLETAYPYTASGYYTGDFVLGLGLCLGGLVSPALLTCLAHRRYALWGLLPTTLLIAWITAGSFVSHTIPALFHPALNLPVLIYLSWFLPLLVLVCWAISCGPISLFRWVWQKRRPQIAPSVSGSPARRCWLLPALLLLLLTLAGLGRYNWTHPKTGHYTVEARFVSGEAQVPLVVENEAIYVMASLNGRRQLCKVDTGADGVLWDRKLHCSGILTGGQGKVCDNENACTETKEILLPRVQIGTMEVINLPTSMQNASHGLFSPAQKSEADTDQEAETNLTPTLGNPCFALTVLTIDYRHKILTVRPAKYDFQKQPRHLGDCVLQMGWTTHSEDSKEEQKLAGWPTLSAYVEGKQFRCVFDSGWGPQLGISKDFLRQLPQNHHRSQTATQQNFLYGPASVTQLDYLDYQFPLIVPQSAAPLHLQNQVIVVSSIGGGEGVVGTDLMKRYQITIDYQRRRILLEPYARTAPRQKQEKSGAGAKQ